ncbi:unnamed protein product [Thelazia callipaeda]|uniref:DRBM domain-containing protein n=1 Tax=Thelazia callipaeda TaxID=103827 RepID=A0A0N5D0D5_THECL|nr:unnamed protein product [Thelazia callipaeda]
MLTGLVEGTFLFDLTVFDSSEAVNSSTISVTALMGVPHLQSVEMYLRKKMREFTYRMKNKLEERLSATLSSHVRNLNRMFFMITEASSVAVVFSIIDEDPSTGRIHIVFRADFTDVAVQGEVKDVSQQKKEVAVVEAWKVVKILRSETNMIAEFKIDSVDSLCKFPFHSVNL